MTAPAPECSQWRDEPDRPRPERPELEELERRIPHYRKRYLMRRA